MKLHKLIIENFGPFRSYTIPFVKDDPVCLLLTGKNNEGKSNILFALKLLAIATRTVNRNKFRVVLDDEVVYRLPQQDTEGIVIGRLLHNYQGNQAIIRGEFDDGLQITVTLDEPNDLIYCDHLGRIPQGIENTFGILPPLGPLAEKEEFLSIKHVRASIGTTLAPRHLRNHFAQILTPTEYRMVQEIVGSSWPSIELLKWEQRTDDNTIRCFFKEGRIDRELCWAGQGLQVWFQILTHLVRLRDTSIVVLDEPEINLHPEKQNDLIRLLREYHSGSVIIATHSVELMNNVNVSHILHVQKTRRQPQIKATTDRAYLDVVRSQIGSNFNLVASQFESFDRIVFTEDTFDFNLLMALSTSLGRSISSFNIPLHGFSEYRKAFSYREAYKLLIGRDIPYSMLLDRDYYPDMYLDSVRREVTDGGIHLVFTPGKEIENCFIHPSVLRQIFPNELWDDFLKFWDKVFSTEHLDCYGSYLTLHEKFITPHLDMKSVTTRYTPDFITKWNDPTARHLAIGGKKALQYVRGFYRKRCGKNLTQRVLVAAAVSGAKAEVEKLIAQIFDILPMK